MILEQVFLHTRLKEALWTQDFQFGTFYEFLANLIVRQPEIFVQRGYLNLLVNYCYFGSLIYDINCI